MKDNTQKLKWEKKGGEIYKRPEVLGVKDYCTHIYTYCREYACTESEFSKLEVIDNNEVLQWLCNQ